MGQAMSLATIELRGLRIYQRTARDHEYGLKSLSPRSNSSNECFVGPNLESQGYRDCGLGPEADVRNVCMLLKVSS